ncbi:MAG: methylmalonyl-CoA carboxyltransferase [Candidatus Rokubacteria bacterium RIFCSPLOWO2_12_FULL_71_19]|nr:MAG: methylmalonyl-CoA carboxyltransferase [Candidatus Rokubacteria bacterium RIFCSPLOWO2_12_FULL_71_19]
MASDDMIEELRERNRQALAMGGPEKLEARRAAGVMNARERIEHLLDPDSFVEAGLFAAGIREEVRHKSPADGKIAGVGRIAGRPVALVSNDFTVLGASSSVVNMKKLRHMKKLAVEHGMPLILLGESTGSRMPDRMGAAGRATLAQDPTEYRRLREAPMVSALLGECYGSSTWYSCISDFRVMRKGARMAVASSRVTSIAISQPVDPEELGGWQLHSEVSGLIDVVAESDADALDTVKRYLGYMPGHAGELPPEYPGFEPGGDQAKVLEILPESRSRVYDARDILRLVVDRGSFFELKAGFGKPIVTALARLGGKSVGLVANNPKFKGGAIDVDSMQKATGFLVHCDSFNIPLVFYVDQPGFLVGVDGERRGAPGKIMNWMNALQLVTVPKVTVIARKNYGQAYLNMCGGHAADWVILWPMADLGFMDPTVGVNVLYDLREQDDPERFRQLRAELARDTSAWDLAALYEGHMVIDPRETRTALLKVLDVLRRSPHKGLGQHHLRNWPTSY